MDFDFFEVTHPFKILTKAVDLPSMPLPPLQNVYLYNILPSMGTLEGLRLKIPVRGSDWKLSRNIANKR